MTARRLAFTPFLILLVVLSQARGAGAQQVEREVQVPLDSIRGIAEVDERLRSDLGLFPEVQGFQSARLFRTSGGGYVLEVTYRDAGSGSLARERRHLTDSDLANFRSVLQERLAASGRARVLDRQGRAGFVVGQTAIGLGYHGWVAAEVFDFQSDRGRLAAYLLTSGASFLGPVLLTSRIPMTIAQRDASFWGSTRGILYGHLAGNVVRPEGSESFSGDDGRRRVRLGLGSAVSVLGSVIGYHAARYAQDDPGTVALWSVAGDFGLAGAFATSYALGLFEGEECYFDTCYTDDYRRTRAGSAATLGLGLASLFGAKAWGDAEDYTVGDARALRSFGLLGAHAFLPAAVELFDDEEGGGDRKIAASGVLGGAAALYLGNKVLRGTSLTGGEGLLVLAGHVAGGLAALGVTYLLDSSSSGDAPIYLATSAAGAAIGSILTFQAVKGNSPPSGARGSNPSAPRGLRAANLTLHPEAALASFLGTGPDASRVRPPLPSLLTVRF